MTEFEVEVLFWLSSAEVATVKTRRDNEMQLPLGLYVDPLLIRRRQLKIENSSMRIIVLGDNPDQQLLLHEALRSIDNAVNVVGTAKEFSFAVGRESFDVLVLAWNLPDAMGISVMRRLRQVGNQVPVLFLTVRDAEEDDVEALDAGVDDYLIKPLWKEELIERLLTLVRRGSMIRSNSKELQYGYFHFNLYDQTVAFQENLIQLTKNEYRLALLFFLNIGRPLSRGYLRDEVWGVDSKVSARTMDTHASRVRRKLNLRPDNGFYLTPVYNYGYRLEDIVWLT